MPILPKLKILTAILLPFLFITIAFADTTPPVTSHTISPSTPDGNNGWYVNPVQFTLSATDLESGVSEIRYRIDGRPWQNNTFNNLLNLAPNPSFETAGATSTGAAYWDATVLDGKATYSRDTAQYYPGFPSSAAKIVASSGPWHAINNKNEFAVATPFENMSASVWVKSQNSTGPVYFNMYSVNQDGTGPLTYSLIGSSGSITGTNDWTKLSLNFVVSNANAIGVYMDVGLGSNGTIWIDAVSITSSLTGAQTIFSVATDSTDHTVEYYAIDNAGNTESYSCPTNNCVKFKLDQTPPGNWINSGAFRSVGGGSNADHELFVFTDVSDLISGLSTNTNRYLYSVETESGFGRYQDLIACNTPWQQNTWVNLLDSPGSDGVNTYSLLTPKTDFCNSNWKICKVVRFYAEDVAGNSTTKDFCLNGPWIRFRGEGMVRTNQNIDMLAEPEEDNTDALIELGGTTVDFFTSAKNWLIRQSTKPRSSNYTNLLSLVSTPTPLGTDLVAANGVYINEGDYEITNQKTPNSYNSAEFDQVVFINGNLRISTPIEVDELSTALFVVSGNVEIDKQVNTVGIAILTDGDFYTAYDINPDEATQTLNLNGIYKANKFHFQRTLQGTGNNKDPSENFIFEPKYIIQQRELFGRNRVSWRSIQ